MEANISTFLKHQNLFKGISTGALDKSKWPF